MVEDREKVIKPWREQPSSMKTFLAGWMYAKSLSHQASDEKGIISWKVAAEMLQTEDQRGLWLPHENLVVSHLQECACLYRLEAAASETAAEDILRDATAADYQISAVLRAMYFRDLALANVFDSAADEIQTIQRDPRRTIS